MRLALYLLIATVATNAATLALDPPVIYDCAGSVGKATIRWTGAAAGSRIEIGPGRALFSQPHASSGSMATEAWVSDGLEFRLTTADGGVQATVVAQVACGTRNVPANGLVTESYFPLQIGNRWVYRRDNRFRTADYVTWQVGGVRSIGGRVYATLLADGSLIALLREDAEGTIWRFTGTEQNPSEAVFLNPRAATHAPYRSEFGSYADAATAVETATLLRDTRTFLRGIGLAASRQDLLTGSSGGFTEGLRLIEFHLASGPRVAATEARITVSAGRTLLNVTAREVDNCVIPCYYTACGIGSPVDPVGTYKPCVRTRVEASAEGDAWTEVVLMNASGQAVFRSPVVATSGDTVRFVQVPLYSEPNHPLPSGTYTLVGRSGQGSTELGVAGLRVEIR
jgi:hypothetical protein